MQGEFSLKLDKIHRFIASGYGWDTEKGAVAHATAPLLVFYLLFFRKTGISMACGITYFSRLRKLHTIPKIALHKNNVS